MQPALDAALRFLGARPRSEREVRRRLSRAHVDEAVVDAVVAQLRRASLLDDAAFAEYWVDQRRTFRPRGPRLLRAELQRLGVATGIAAQAACSAEPSVEDDAYRAAAKRARQISHLERRAFETRLGAFLARRGFDWDVTSSVVQRLWHELSTSSDSAPAPTA